MNVFPRDISNALDRLNDERHGIEHVDHGPMLDDTRYLIDGYVDLNRLAELINEERKEPKGRRQPTWTTRSCSG